MRVLAETSNSGFIYSKADHGNPMKQLALFLLFVTVTLLCAGCGIPDLPGPIGIPGL